MSAVGQCQHFSSIVPKHWNGHIEVYTGKLTGCYQTGRAAMVQSTTPCRAVYRTKYRGCVNRTIYWDVNIRCKGHPVWHMHKRPYMLTLVTSCKALLGAPDGPAGPGHAQLATACSAGVAFVNCVCMCVTALMCKTMHVAGVVQGYAISILEMQICYMCPLRPSPY